MNTILTELGSLNYFIFFYINCVIAIIAEMVGKRYKDKDESKLLKNLYRLIYEILSILALIILIFFILLPAYNYSYS